MSEAPKQEKPVLAARRGRTVAVLILSVAASAAGDLLLSQGMRQVGAAAPLDATNLQTAMLAAMATPTVLIGIGCMAVFFALYLTALSWADLSFALPITALSFVLVALFAGIFLHEHVSPLRWLGVLSILCGVIFIAHSES